MPKASKGYGLKESCSNRRYDRATGKFVRSCDEPQKPQKGALEDVEVRFIMRCDESGEPAEVKLLSVSSNELREFKKQVRRGELSKADLQTYTQVLHEEVETELQKRFERQRSAESFERSLKSSQATKAAATRKAKSQKLNEAQRREAGDQAKALELRIKALKNDLETLKRGKNIRKREQVQARIRRLSKAVTQLQKVAVGKAYKLPSAAEMR